MSRRRFSAEEKAALWRAWKSGLKLLQIAQLLNRRSPNVLQILRRDGGFAPRTRRRAARALQVQEREEISRGLSGGLSIREIARRLGRAASTVSREIRRNGGERFYRPPMPMRVLGTAHVGRRPVCWRGTGDSGLGWPSARAWIGLLGHLRRGGFMRRPRTQTIGHPNIVDGISIRERPAEIEHRAVPGHWEGDLLMGGTRSQIATLVERHSRYVMLVKVDSKDTVTVTNALKSKIRELPAQLRRSLTWDRGSEMAAHKEFTLATDMQVYFCDPRSPWQRGSNENTNGLLRQYFPKGQDLSQITQARLNQVARQLNERPRETLNWRTPLEALKATVASTG